MTEQQLINWARSLTFGQQMSFVTLVALAVVVVALICVAASQLLPGGEDNAPDR
jgi:hypothetical protein